MSSVRRFDLVRDVDETGVSGTGTIAQGVRFGDGTVALRWLSDNASTAVWGGTEEMLAVHGHGGLTRIEWVDGED